MKDLNKKSTDFGWLGLIISLGIVYGDLGTSPLYTMSAITRGNPNPSTDFILGALSCVFWTLTLQTTLKYIIITLRANNHGEGGILLLLTLLKNRKRWIYTIAIIGACALLGDGIITPAVTVTSAVEGIQHYFPHINTPLWVVVILSMLFMAQQFGTASLGKAFGPIMLLWFTMMGIMGIRGIMEFPAIFSAINPIYAIRLIMHTPHVLVLLGAVFLCTTGAEALYSDLGHCGSRNIQVSWIFVKASLILNYFGQGAWILSSSWTGSNPFFDIMPSWFLPFGIILATLAAIIASQALITGSYTIVSEAVSLRLFPKIKIHYPSTIKGQMYIPIINRILWIGCIAVVLYFQKSSAMESAYGLSISLAMLMTTLLLIQYIRNKYSTWVAVLAGVLFLSIESCFLVANLTKFTEGGWVSIAICAFFASIMMLWSEGQWMERIHTTFSEISKFGPMISDLSKDESIPKYASQLVYLTHSNNKNNIENQILYSIFRNHPKRADRYWLLRIKISDDPRRMEYSTTEIIPGILNRVDLHLGFKVPPRINLYFQQVLIDLKQKTDLHLDSQYDSLAKHHILTDFRYIIIDRVQNNDKILDFWPRFILNKFYWIKQRMVNLIKAYGFDPTRTKIEYVPLMKTSELFYEDLVKENKDAHKHFIIPKSS